MIDSATLQRLQAIYRRESRSFLQYIREASPWATPADRPLVARVTELAVEESRALDSFGLWLENQRTALPYLGAFSTGFASFNFVNIRTLLKELLPRQRQELAQLEGDTEALQGEAQQQVMTLTDLNRKHLAELLPMNEASTTHTPFGSPQ